MLIRRAAVVMSAVATGLAATVGPAAAGDGAGSNNGSLWGAADYNGGGDNSGSSGSNGGDGTSDAASDSTGSGSGGGGGGIDTCADDSLALQMLGAAGGGCGYVPYDDAGDPGVVPVVVDAREQAERAFERLPLATADVRIAPGPPLPTYPNLETWIWVPRSQWETLTLEVNAGPTTVHVEARPVRIDIDAGERDTMKYSSTPIDSTFSCSGPGRPWHESLGDDAETSCSYTYRTTSKNNPEGGDHYTLTASIVYEASWTCVGQCSDDGGSLGEVDGPTGSLPVVVQERQSVVVE